MLAERQVLTLALDRRLPLSPRVEKRPAHKVARCRVDRRRYPLQAMAGVTSRMFWMKAAGRNSAGAMTQRLSGSLPMRTMPMC